MPPYLQKCTRCPAEFPWIAGKKYCSKRCRNDKYKEEKSEGDLFLNSLPVVKPPSDILSQFAENPLEEPMKYVIKSNAPKGAVSFRLGAMRGGSRGTKSPCMKWFPTRFSRTLPVYSLPEWETVQLPFVGTWVVAYFDEDCRLLGLPTFQVEVPFAVRHYSWSSGDDQLVINPKRMY